MWELYEVIDTFRNPVQFLNALTPMLVILDGMVMEFNPVQPSNAPLPILVTLDGMNTEVNAEQFKNAKLPILVTLLPKTIDVRFGLLLNNGFVTAELLNVPLPFDV